MKVWNRLHETLQSHDELNWILEIIVWYITNHKHIQNVYIVTYDITESDTSFRTIV